MRKATQVSQQAGIAAFMITMMLMIIITLIVLGFSEVANRNQSQGLDKQLSNQAYYAAESAINDARQIITDEVISNVENGTPLYDKTTCGAQSIPGATPKDWYANLDGTVYSNTLNKNVSYSCLLIKTTVENLQASLSSNAESSKVMPINAANNTPIKSVNFEWSSNGGPNFTSCPSAANQNGNPYSVSQGSCSYGVLRFDIVPSVEVGSYTLNRQNLINNTMTAFLYPSNTSSVNSISKSGAYNIDCSSGKCSVTVTPPLTGVAYGYTVRVSALYNTVPLTISADSATGTVGLTGAQAEIDATGKAQDVLRRVVVRMPLSIPSDQSLFADGPLTTYDSICKRFEVAPVNGQFQPDYGSQTGCP